MASSLAMLVLVLSLRSGGAIAVSSSYISRTTEQQIIASAAPAAFTDADADGQSEAQGLPFLASPSGSFAAYLRRATVENGGGSSSGGGDLCYVEVVQQQGGGGGTSSVWESDCTPVGGADTCDLAFSPVGLELFAGGHSLWDTAVDSDPEMLSLDGAGDMRIVSRDGVTVWRTRDEPWTGQRCGAHLPVSSSLDSTVDVLPPPKATTGAKLLTPPVATSTLASPWGSDFSFGDQTAPPFDTEPDQVLPPPPPADDEGSTDFPDMPLPQPPPPADPSIYWPDLPLPPPPADTYPIPETPEQPLYSSPPPALPTSFVPPQAPLPPLDTPPLVPPSGAGIATPPASSGGDTGTPFLPPPVGTPHPHPHHLPLGASPPLVPGAVAPISGGHGAGLPFGQGQGQGVFGQQQNQLLNGGGQPLEDSAAGGWSGRESGGAVVSLALVGVVALFFGF